MFKQMYFHTVCKAAVNTDGASAFSAFYMKVRTVPGTTAVPVCGALAYISVKAHNAAVMTVEFQSSVNGCFGYMFTLFGKTTYYLFGSHTKRMLF